MGEKEKTAAATVTQNKVPESAQRAVASLGLKTTLFGEEKDCEKSLRSLKRLWERAQRSRAVIECAASRATASKASAPPSATYSSSSSAVHAGSVVAAQN